MERSPGAPVGRSLSTAREVLVLLQALRKAPEGMSAEQCARVIGKSRSTATYLLNALRLEGFAIYDSKARTYHASDPLASEPCRARWEAALEEGLSELYRRTGERTYAAKKKKKKIKEKEIMR
jgi:DNA-binding IclR family transcriptional regulator